MQSCRYSAPPGGPAGDAELTDQNFCAVLLLERSYRLQDFPQLFPIPAAVRIFPCRRGIVFGIIRIADPLVRILSGRIHVHLINDVFQRQRGQTPESVGGAPVIALHDDRNLRIDLADCPRGIQLQLSVVELDGAALVRLVDQIVPVDHRATAEPGRDSFPRFEEGIPVFRIVHHQESRIIAVETRRLFSGGAEKAVIPITAAGRRMHVDDHLDSAALQHRQKRFEFIETPIHPAFILLEIFQIPDAVDDLVPQQIDVPAAEFLNVLGPDSPGRRTHHPAPGGLLAQCRRKIAPEPFREHFSIRVVAHHLVAGIAEFKRSPALLNSENQSGALDVRREFTEYADGFPLLLVSQKRRGRKDPRTAGIAVKPQNFPSHVPQGEIGADPPASHFRLNHDALSAEFHRIQLDRHSARLIDGMRNPGQCDGKNSISVRALRTGFKLGNRQRHDLCRHRQDTGRNCTEQQKNFFHSHPIGKEKVER